MVWECETLQAASPVALAAAPIVHVAPQLIGEAQSARLHAAAHSAAAAALARHLGVPLEHFAAACDAVLRLLRGVVRRFARLLRGGHAPLEWANDVCCQADVSPADTTDDGDAPLGFQGGSVLLDCGITSVCKLLPQVLASLDVTSDCARSVSPTTTASPAAATEAQPAVFTPTPAGVEVGGHDGAARLPAIMARAAVFSAYWALAGLPLPASVREVAAQQVCDAATEAGLAAALPPTTHGLCAHVLDGRAGEWRTWAELQAFQLASGAWVGNNTRGHLAHVNRCGRVVLAYRGKTLHALRSSVCNPCDLIK
jgi:cell division septation protein DedD